MTDDPHDLCPAFLRPDEIAIFLEMSDGDFVYPARYIAEEIGLPVREVRAAQQRFRDLGLADCGPLFSDDDGKIAGKGTWLNRVGWRLQDMMRERIEQ